MILIREAILSHFQKIIVSLVMIKLVSISHRNVFLHGFNYFKIERKTLDS